jgi:hypothetical protein
MLGVGDRCGAPLELHKDTLRRARIRPVYVPHQEVRSQQREDGRTPQQIVVAAELDRQEVAEVERRSDGGS